MSEDNVIKLAAPAAFVADALTEVLRDGARKLLTQAVETEVADFLARYSDVMTEEGRQRTPDGATKCGIQSANERLLTDVCSGPQLRISRRAACGH